MQQVRGRPGVERSCEGFVVRREPQKSQSPGVSNSKMLWELCFCHVSVLKKPAYCRHTEVFRNHIWESQFLISIQNLLLNSNFCYRSCYQVEKTIFLFSILGKTLQFHVHSVYPNWHFVLEQFRTFEAGAKQAAWHHDHSHNCSSHLHL